jgi:hypothetical protein
MGQKHRVVALLVMSIVGLQPPLLAEANLPAATAQNATQSDALRQAEALNGRVTELY